jgi:hypothetical protein
MYRRVAQLTQLLILKPVKQAEASVCCSSRDQGLGAICGAQAIRVGFSVPGRTLLIPPEQGSDATPKPEKPVDDRGRRLASRDHHSPQVEDRAAGAATRERNRPGILQRDVVQQCVHAKGTRAEFTGIDTHRRALLRPGSYQGFL